MRRSPGSSGCSYSSSSQGEPRSGSGCGFVCTDRVSIRLMLKAVPNPPDEAAGHQPTDDEVLRWALAYLRHAPLSLTLREINRLVALESVGKHHGPVLDVGCGDGFWWTMREDNREIYGI